MPSPSFSLRSKALTIVPVALLSGAWTVNLVTTSAVASGNDHHSNLPDGTHVPAKAIESPASVPVPGVIAPGVPKGSVDQVVNGASASGIPSVALAAYQRAAQIIDSADKSCNVPWELIAAIGRVESDHGRTGGSSLNAKGIDHPAVLGPVLNGQHNTQMITDTDGGQLDGNSKYDRAVGPMQFLPSTWEIVKVDADGDGQRNPQDINDAALGTGVYLCSGTENLSTHKGQEAAVYRYNHSHSYVDLVLRIMEAYSAGDYNAVPSGSHGGTLFTPDYTTAVQHKQHWLRTHPQRGATHGASGHSGGSHSGGSHSGTTGGSSTGGGSGGSAGGGGGVLPTPGSGDSGGSGDGAVKKVTDGVKGTVSQAAKPVTDLITQAEAATLCSGHFSGIAKLLKSVPLVGNIYDNAISKCEGTLDGQKQSDSGSLLDAIPNTVSGVLSWLGL